MRNSADRFVMRLLAVILLLLVFSSTSSAETADTIAFSLPEGFTAEVLVADVPNARSLALGERGTLFISTRRLGKLYAVSNPFSDAQEILTIAEELKMPSGITFFDGALYVAEAKRLIRYSGIEENLTAPGEPEILISELPYKNMLHAWKYIDVGPDGKLYMAMGAPCNVCEAEDLNVILRMNPDGTETEVFATGVRNSVGFDWHPETREFWFTDNGRDMMGDEIPPCELNRAHEPGLDFGFPYCHGRDIADPKFGEIGNCADAEPPVQDLGPHVAPLGMVFYTGNMFPETYRGHVFIAEHGSWNRSKSAGKTGYLVSLVTLDGNSSVGYEPFMQGFLDEQEEALGRPVDLLVAPDGSLLVSDDLRGAVYRVMYAGE